MFIKQITDDMIKKSSNLELSDKGRWAVYCAGVIVYLSNSKTRAEKVLKEIL